MTLSPPSASQTRAGFAAILGAPNAGKSTLLNCMLGEKLSIVTAKAQTTRIRVLGLITEGDTQMGVIDTPGIFDPKERLGRAMVQTARQALQDADIAVLLLDASSRAAADKAARLAPELKKRGGRAVLALNKVDKTPRARLLPMADTLFQSGAFEAIFMISALTGQGVDDLKRHLLNAMPPGPWLFPADQLTDLPERLLAAEVTREHLFRQLHDELPYAAAVLPESWEDRADGSVVIHQTILVSRPGHRAIVLGEKGARIKAIGQAARKDLAAQLDRPVHLFLDVRNDPNWSAKSDFYQLFGLEE